MEAAGDSPADINMGFTEILFILLGISAFAASFIIPEKLSGQDSGNFKIEEEKIKELVEEEVKQATFQLEEKVEETISATTEKTERYMERISNEKIMAIQEYSDTVLSQINKNHEEAVFLYDMLNNKHIQVKNTVAEIGNKVQSGKGNVVSKTQEEADSVITESIGAAEADKGAVTISEADAKKGKGPATKRKVPAKKSAIKKSKDMEKISEIEIQFDSGSDIGSDKSKILKLHEEGKSNMAIAKSLGLGIGEVKLIIDLYEAGEA